MEIFAHKTDPLFVPACHLRYKLADAGSIVWKEPVGFQWAAYEECGAVHKEQRNVQAAEHLAVAGIKCFKADDTRGLLGVKGTGKF